VSIIAVVDIQKLEYIAEEEYTLLEGFDSGKMAGLGLPGFFVTSNTCKGHRKELYFETERSGRGCARKVPSVLQQF
jgi:hypothetical protein